jgi:hypothetical protein
MILAYLCQNPEAEDTVEGIVEWWLLEEEIKRRTADVKQALDELGGKGLLVERKGPDGRSRYLVNRARLSEIRAMLEEKNDVEPSG